nr:hypothetical protein [Tanacetum cinerariifolium]GEZ19838.1 hypothetical protein [Tanacetum cinerariifolium]
MSLTFAHTHNMVAYLNKSDASEGFTQVINFLNESYIKYALTVNSTIYVSCIKQFWNTIIVKQSNDVTRLQALVDRKKVVITEAVIRDVLRLNDVDGVDCLPNEEIFAELARMGYEKPSTKLTFYKAFFLSQWKFLIHIILQSMSAKREIEEQGDVEEQVQDNVNDAAQGADTTISGDDVQDQSIPSPTPPTPPPQPPQDLPSTSQVQHTPSQSHPPQPQSPPSAQPQGADFPMSLLQEALDACAALTRRVEHLEHDKVAQALEIIKLKKRVKKLERANKVKVLKLRRLKKVRTSQRIKSSADTDMEDASNQGRMIADLDRDTGNALMDDEGTLKKAKDAQVVGDEQVKRRQAEIYQFDMDHASKVLSMQEDEPEVQEAVDVITTTKLITEVVTAVSESVTAASATIAAVYAATITAAPSKDKGKGIMVEEPKPMKKKQQVEMDEEYARKLHEELNQDIDWSVAIDQVKQKAKEDPYVQRYQVMKKRPQTEAQARRNMIMYLKNVVGFRLDYFKRISYDDIRLIFEAKFNSNMEFLLKTKEQMEEKENRAIESINETTAQKAAKRRKLNKEVEDLKQHLEIVPDEDDDVYTEATPLARKVPVVDYQIIQLNNKRRYKIIRVDGTHQLYVSFITLLKNFDREDLESLWSIVKERFSTSKPKNFFDDYLLTTLRAMFERPDGQDQV